MKRAYASWINMLSATAAGILLAVPFIVKLGTADWISETDQERFEAAQDQAKDLETIKVPKSERESRWPGREQHHIVEQGSNPPDGDVEAKDNVVWVPYYKHQEISRWYQSKSDYLSDMGLAPKQTSPRNYLRGKPFPEQYEFGLDVLRRFGVIK